MCPAPAASGKSVCVMDASGPLGHALVDRLLRRGYTVHAAAYTHLADQDDQDSESLLRQLSSSCSGDKQHRLKVFRADPFDYHTIADAARGCSGLFCMFNTPHDQATCDEAMAEMEVRAAHNVLEACAQTETMERVVFTSSVTAVVWKENHKLVDAFDEKNWSELSFCRKFKLWHALAKTLSEKTAWALAMDRGVDMVAINAGLLTGPGLTAAHPYLKGAPDMYEDGVLVTVDVDFLADAHVAVYESPTAYGRYLCFNNAVCGPEDAVKLAQMLSPSAPRSPPRGTRRYHECGEWSRCLSPLAPAPRWIRHHICIYPCMFCWPMVVNLLILDYSDELKVIPQRIQDKKLNKLMVEFASGIYGELD